MEQSPDEQVVLISDGAVAVVQSLKQEPGDAVWLCGGAALARSLLAANLVDKMIIKLNPVVFGSGIPLFGGDIEPTTLRLTGSKTFHSGHVLLHYSVNDDRG